MRKRHLSILSVAAALLVLISAGSAMAFNKWVPFNGAESTELLSVSVPVSTLQEVEVDISVPGMSTADLVKNGITYQSVALQDSGYTSEIGKPQLPMVGRFIAIPAGAAVNVEVVDSTSKVLDGYTIYPAQEPLPDVKDAPKPTFAMDAAAYQRDGFYPSEIVKLEGPSNIRDCSVVILRVFPVQFNPVKKTLRVYSNIRVRVSFQGGEGYFIEKRYRSESFDNMFKRLFLNDPTITDENEPDAAYGTNDSLLIITHSTFLAAANTLATWKREKGIHTTVVTTSTTGSTASSIQSYIQNAYNTWTPPPTYVLFIGDAEFIPCHYVTSHPYIEYPYQGHIGTDLYYATVVGTDYFPDINTGRISVDTLSQATKRVNDIIGYEKTPYSGSSFYQNAAICAYFQDIEDPPRSYLDHYADRRFAQTSEDLAIFLSSASYLGQYSVDRIYYHSASLAPWYWNKYYFGGGPAGNAGDLIPSYLRKDIWPYFPWDGDQYDITNAVNNGRFLVTHRDHGARWGWSEPYFHRSHVDALTNSNKLPVVWSMNCQTGWFDNETDDAITGTPTTEVNFCEAWERNTNGGAVGLIGATRISYSDHNDRLCWGWTDGIWPSFLTYSGTWPIYEMGPVLNYGKFYYATIHSESTTRKAEFEMFHWFGDPTMQIYTDVPQNLSVSHDSSVRGGDTSFDVTVGSNTGVVIAISRNGQLLGRDYVYGASTNTIYWQDSVQEGEQLVVTVTGHNYRAYQKAVYCEICECDLNNDGSCDGLDWFAFIEDWGRTDCPPMPFAEMETIEKPVVPNNSEFGNPDGAPIESSTELRVWKVEEALPDGDQPVLSAPKTKAKKKAAPVEEIDEAPEATAVFMPLWSSLENFVLSDKENGVLHLEVAGDLEETTQNALMDVEALWNTGKFEEAIDALQTLESGGLAVAAGITWKTPKTVDNLADWGGDVRIGTKEYIYESTLDFDAQTGNLFAFLRYSGGGSFYFSTNGGKTWSLKHSWIGSLVDASISVVSDYCYIASVFSSQPQNAYITRHFVSTGGWDSGYGTKLLFNKDVDIEEIVLSSNADEYDNRIRCFAILKDLRLIYYWDSYHGTSFSEISTGVNFADRSLDACENQGGLTGSGWAMYVSFIAHIIQGAESSHPLYVWRRGFSGNEAIGVESDPVWDSPTGISAYADNIITVFEYEDASGNNGIKYRISYNGGDKWYYSYIARAQEGKHFWNPDVASRKGRGIAFVYQEEVGEPDICWYRYRPYSGGGFTTPEQFNEIDVVTGSLMEMEYLPPFAGAPYGYGSIWISNRPNGAYFDRKDADICECDLNNDGSCDGLDWFAFIEDWGRTNCPTLD